MLSKTNPLIIITAPLSENSLFRPKEGKILSHFGSVLVLIKDDERYVEYTLVQHPFLPEKRLLRWKPREPKKKVPLRSEEDKREEREEREKWDFVVLVEFFIRLKKWQIMM